MRQIAPDLRDNILLLADTYRRITGRKETGLAFACYGSGYFLSQLRAGECSFGIGKYDQVIYWFEHNWPEGHAMPRLIDPTHQQETKSHGTKPRQGREAASRKKSSTKTGIGKKGRKGSGSKARHQKSHEG